jgi:hypothetical protein
LLIRNVLQSLLKWCCMLCVSEYDGERAGFQRRGLVVQAMMMLVATTMAVVAFFTEVLALVRLPFPP